MAELHLFDFDGTLFRSPYPPAAWSQDDWWSNVESLVAPCVPDRPGSEWWVSSSVAQAKRSISDRDVYAVLMTGRPDSTGHRYRVPELLRQKGLGFDEVHLSKSGDTLSWKKKMLARFLNRFPFIEKVRIWDDRKSHLSAFETVVERMGREVETNWVSAKSRPPGCGEEAVPAPPTKKKVSYLALFLDSKSRTTLSHEFPYAHDKAFADHITLSVSPSPELLEQVGRKGFARVVGYAEDDKAQVVKVVLVGDIQDDPGRIPHVTMSTAPGVEAKYSNELLRSGDVQRVTGGPILSGIIDVYPRSLTRPSPARVAAMWSGGSAMWEPGAE